MPANRRARHSVRPPPALLTLADLEALHDEIYDLFDSQHDVNFSYTLYTGTESLEFDSIDELKSFPSLPEFLQGFQAGNQAAPQR